MFTEEVIEAVWQKATKIDDYDPNRFRKDCCGAWIIRNAYGNENSIYGWEIDHVYPQSKGGQDDIDNLRAMQWENNRSKGDDFPSYSAKVKASGNENVYEESSRCVNEDLQVLLRNLYNIG